MSLDELPVEIVQLIADQLDSISQLNLSLTCNHFYDFFKQNPSTKDLNLSNAKLLHHISYDTVFQFVQNNNLIVRHLDLSYLHWLTKQDVRRIVRNLPNLLHLNLIATGMRSRDVAFILHNNESVNSLEMTYDHTIVQMSPYLKTLHLFIDTDEYAADYSAWYNIENIKFTASVLSGYPTMLHLAMNVFKEIEFVMFATDYIYNSYIIQNFSSCEFLLIFVEGLHAIYLSPSLLDEFQLSSPFLRVKNIIECEPDSFRYVFMCHKSYPERVEKLKNLVRKCIHSRTKDHIFIVGPHYCPNITKFNIVETLTSTENLQHLSVQPCSLIIQPKSERALIRAGRISAVQSEEVQNCSLQKIINRHENVHTLEVLGPIIHNRCVGLSSSTKFVNSAYLSPICNMKKLENLLITKVPYFKPLIFSSIFEGCKMLRKLSIIACVDDLLPIRNLCMNIHHCKHLKVFLLQAKWDIEIINDLSKCRSLEIVHVIYYKPVIDLYIGNILFAKYKASILELVDSCPNLTKLAVINESRRSKSFQNRCRALEKLITIIKGKLVINLTKLQYFTEATF